MLTYDVLYTQFSTQGSIVLKRGEKMLDNRKKKILQAIVEEYIETAEPVSSKSIVEKHGIDYSSATIRNDMAELEKIGLLDKPHTSAGRIPSAQGYRYYVDELLNYNDISMQEIKYIQTQLATKVNQIEDLTKIATSTLSEITHYTSVGIGPRVASQNIEEVKFVLLGSRILMAIILTESGLVKETIIKFDEDVTQEQVDTITYLFNNKLKGKPLTQIDKPMEEYMHSEMSSVLNVAFFAMLSSNSTISSDSFVSNLLFSLIFINSFNVFLSCALTASSASCSFGCFFSTSKISSNLMSVLLKLSTLQISSTFSIRCCSSLLMASIRACS